VYILQLGTSINDDVHYVRRVFCDLIKAWWRKGVSWEPEALEIGGDCLACRTRGPWMARGGCGEDGIIDESSMNWRCHLIADDADRLLYIPPTLALHTFQFVAAIVHVISVSVSANGSRWHATAVCTYLTHTHTHTRTARRILTYAHMLTYGHWEKTSWLRA